MNARRALLASGVLILLTILAVACASDGVSTTGTVAVAPTTAPPTTQTTVPDDDAYPAAVQAWLDKYAANLEEAVDANDPLAWSGTPEEQTASAKVAAALAHDAFNSFRAIQPGLYLWEYHYDYLMLLDRLVQDFDEIAAGQTFSAAWGYPRLVDVEEARRTLEQMLGLSGSAAITPTTTAPSTTEAKVIGQTPSKEVLSVLEGRIAALDGGDGKAAAAFYAVDAIMEELDQDPPLVTTGRTAIGDRLEELVDVWGLRMRAEGTPIQFDRYVAEPVGFYPAEGSGTGAGMLVFEIDKDNEITHQWAIGWVD